VERRGIQLYIAACRRPAFVIRFYSSMLTDHLREETRNTFMI
jgi:hypothetical protein